MRVRVDDKVHTAFCLARDKLINLVKGAYS